MNSLLPEEGRNFENQGLPIFRRTTNICIIHSSAKFHSPQIFEYMSNFELNIVVGNLKGTLGYRDFNLQVINIQQNA